MLIAAMIGCELFGIMMGCIIPDFVLPKEEQHVLMVDHMQKILIIEAGIIFLTIPCVFFFLKSEKSIHRRISGSLSDTNTNRKNSNSSSCSSSEIRFVSLSLAEK